MGNCFVAENEPSNEVDMLWLLTDNGLKWLQTDVGIKYIMSNDDIFCRCNGNPGKMYDWFACENGIIWLNNIFLNKIDIKLIRKNKHVKQWFITNHQIIVEKYNLEMFTDWISDLFIPSSDILMMMNNLDYNFGKCIYLDDRYPNIFCTDGAKWTLDNYERFFTDTNFLSNPISNVWFRTEFGIQWLKTTSGIQFITSKKGIDWLLDANLIDDNTLINMCELFPFFATNRGAKYIRDNMHLLSYGSRFINYVNSLHFVNSNEYNDIFDVIDDYMCESSFLTESRNLTP